MYVLLYKLIFYMAQILLLEFPFSQYTQDSRHGGWESLVWPKKSGTRQEKWYIQESGWVPGWVLVQCWSTWASYFPPFLSSLRGENHTANIIFCLPQSFNPTLFLPNQKKISWHRRVHQKQRVHHSNKKYILQLFEYICRYNSKLVLVYWEFNLVFSGMLTWTVIHQLPKFFVVIVLRQHSGQLVTKGRG